MKKNKRLLIVPSLLILPFTASSSIALNDSPKMKMAELSIQDEYKLNSKFTLPTLTKDGVTYSCVIEFPSGASYYQSEVVLSEVGVYTLHFSAEKDGRFYSETETFLVRNPFVSFNGTKSFSSYEKSERTYDKQGLYVSLAEGETLTFSEPIDLSKDGNIIELFVTPSTLGVINFSELYFTLSEVDNPDNVLTIRAKASGEGVSAPWTYLSAKGTGQLLTGYEAQWNNIHINNDYGTPITHSFYGTYSPYYPSRKPGEDGSVIGFKYDSNEKALYTDKGGFVIDFDDPKYFSTLWNGFDSSLVNLSIYARGYSLSSANFLITSLLGQDISTETIIDTKGPEIAVNLPGAKAPSAKKGLTYPIFEATAKDDKDGECEVTSRVYFNYGSDKTTMVPVINNRFEVANEGVYGIVYEAKDRSGNISSKVVVVTTDENVKEIKIKDNESIAKEGKQGERYSFPKFDVEGGSGDIETSYMVTKDGAAYESDEDGFIPRELGTYKVSFIAKDILGQEDIHEYEYTALANDGAVLYEEPKFLKYYISDSVYTLPEATIYDYSSGTPTPVSMNVKISNDSFSYDAVSGDSFVPKITSSQEELELEYSYKNVKKTYKINVISPYNRKKGIDRFAIENYLVGDNMTFDIGDNDVGFYATKKGDASFVFANPIIAENSSIVMASDSANFNFKKVNVVFTDSYDENEKVTVSLLTDSSGEITYGIDGRAYETSSSFLKNNSLSVAYSDGYFSFNGTGVKINHYDDGSLFNGFSSKKALISVELVDAKEGAGLRLSKIDNQSISYSTGDYGGPRIAIHGDYGGSYSYGDYVTINRIDAGDVYDPNVSCTVTVKNPSGNIVKDTNGNPLDGIDATIEHQIQISEYGQYIITYTAVDSSDNKTNFIYAINVDDATAPTIEITGEVPSSIKVGETFIVPSYTVSDDLDENIIVSVYIETPYGQTYYLDKHNAFKPQNEGTYTLRIRAMDSAGNIAYASITFEVTK